MIATKIFNCFVGRRAVESHATHNTRSGPVTRADIIITGSPRYIVDFARGPKRREDRAKMPAALAARLVRWKCRR